MINESLIVDILEESYKTKQKYWERYEKSHNANDNQSAMIYRESYIRALDLYSARYQMLLSFGYDVVTDENNNIIGIKEI